MELKKVNKITRERIFGLYAGQRVMTSDSFFDDCGHDHFEKPILSLSKYPGMFLKLKPLGKLSVEDVKRAAMKCFPLAHFADFEKGYSEKIEVRLYLGGEAHFSIYEGGRSQFAINYRTGELRFVSMKSAMLPEPHYLDYFDFLRSQGYALPAFGFSVEELYHQNIFWWPEEWETKNADFNGLVVEQV